MTVNNYKNYVKVFSIPEKREKKNQKHSADKENVFFCFKNKPIGPKLMTSLAISNSFATQKEIEEEI